MRHTAHSVAIPTSIAWDTMQAWWRSVRPAWAFQLRSQGTEIGAFLVLGDRQLLISVRRSLTLAVSGRSVGAVPHHVGSGGRTRSCPHLDSVVLSWLAEPRPIWRAQVSVALPFGRVALAVVFRVYARAGRRPDLLVERQATTLLKASRTSSIILDSLCVENSTSSGGLTGAPSYIVSALLTPSRPAGAVVDRACRPLRDGYERPYGEAIQTPDYDRRPWAVSGGARPEYLVSPTSSRMWE